MPAKINKSDILLDDPFPAAREIPTPLENGENAPAAADGPGILLKKPIEFEGKTISFISTDFSRVNGKELKAAAREYKMRFKPAPDKSFVLDSDYLILVFARINNVDESFFDLLPGDAYLQLTEFFKLGMSSLMDGNP
jgi:hypothetical protein